MSVPVSGLCQPPVLQNFHQSTVVLSCKWQLVFGLISQVSVAVTCAVFLCTTEPPNHRTNHPPTSRRVKLIAKSYYISIRYAHCEPSGKKVSRRHIRKPDPHFFHNSMYKVYKHLVVYLMGKHFLHLCHFVTHYFSFMHIFNEIGYF